MHIHMQHIRPGGGCGAGCGGDADAVDAGLDVVREAEIAVQELVLTARDDRALRIKQPPGGVLTTCGPGIIL